MISISGRKLEDLLVYLITSYSLEPVGFWNCLMYRLQSSLRMNLAIKDEVRKP